MSLFVACIIFQWLISCPDSLENYMLCIFLFYLVYTTAKSELSSTSNLCFCAGGLGTCYLPLQVESRKLAPNFIAPFKVDRFLNPTAVQLKLPPSLKVHTTFHVLLLKPVNLNLLLLHICGQANHRLYLNNGWALSHHHSVLFSVVLTPLVTALCGPIVAAHLDWCPITALCTQATSSPTSGNLAYSNQNLELTSQTLTI